MIVKAVLVFIIKIKVLLKFFNNSNEHFFIFE